MSDKITFAELVEKISAKTDQSEQTTNDFIHELAEIIETSLGTGEKISISGFGKFELRWVDERKGRNPQTGEEITIPGLGTFKTKTREERKVYSPHHESYMMVPPKRVVDFTPSSNLKDNLKFVETGDE